MIDLLEVEHAKNTNTNSTNTHKEREREREGFMRFGKKTTQGQREILYGLQEITRGLQGFIKNSLNFG